MRPKACAAGSRPPESAQAAHSWVRTHGIELGKEAVAFAKEVFNLELGNHTIDIELQRSGPKSYDIVSFFMVSSCSPGETLKRR